MNAPIGVTFEKNQTAILGRVPIFSTERLTAEVAGFILAMELAPQDRVGLNELAEKARQGELTPDEDIEIEEYRRAGRVVEMFRLKARVAQQKQSA